MDDADDADPGLARERTELAWNRTAIAFAALGGVVIRDAPAAGLLILAMSALVFLAARTVRPGGYPRRRSLLLVTMAVTAVSLAALALALLGGGGR
jgi:uncharacterized membrane protein YidH (DUF202 family)